MENPAQAQGAQPQDQPAVETPVAPAAPESTPAPVGDGPWASDLAILFPDATQRGAVDQFLRDKVQPYTTKLEQQVAGAKDAERLWTDLNQSPVDTYVAITHELFGEQAAQQLLTTLQQQTEQQPAAPEAPQQPSPQDALQDPRLQNVLQWVEQKQVNDYYDSEIQRIVAEHPDVDPELLHPFVASAEGDFNKAYELYSQWLGTWSAKHAGTIDPATPAPPTIGSDSATPPAPPVQPTKETLEEAIMGFVADQRANAEAPPVT